MSPVISRSTVRRVAAAAVVSVLALLGVVAMPMSASAATFSVTNLADSGAGSLRDAIATANGSAGPDIITFDPAFIPANSVIEVDSPISISEDLVIDGSGVAGLTIAPGVAGTYPLLFVQPSAAGQSYEFSDFDIDGTAGAAGWTGWGIYTTAAASVPLNVTLDGMIVRNLTGPEGPAFYVFATNAAGIVTISNSIFENNTSTASAGGAIHLRGVQGSVEISNSTFEDNTSSGDGGALYVDGTGGGTPSLTIDTVNFLGNESTAGAGGAIASNLIANVSIIAGQFVGNISAGAGGAIELTLQDSTRSFDIAQSQFSQNNAGGGGGAISVSALNGADVSVSDSVFDLNTSGGNGGALLLSNLADADVTVTTSTFSNNSTDASGGAVSIDTVANALIELIGNTFANNFSPNATATGGTSLNFGLLDEGATVAIANSTFYEPNPLVDPIIYVDTIGAGGESANPAQFFIVSSTLIGYNGVLEVNSNQGLAIVSHSIVNGDFGNVGSVPIDMNGTSVAGVEYDILTTPFDAANTFNIGNSLFSTNPQLGALASNGGPTQTMLPLAGSPAINAGDLAYGFGFTTDQRGSGFARIVNGRVDIGAVEFRTLALAATGVEVNPLLVGGGAVLLLLGAAALLVTRRRRAA